MPAPAGKKRILWVIDKHHGTKTEEELAQIREKYRSGVPPEIIDHMAGKIADQIIEEGKCGDILE